ncbi:sulfate ABC transporter permease subunit CysT [Azospirillum doebereinerae]|uniref:Sulfate transport system permease protein CysT n=1 Tax=Azospirillum doebereinerae TaxID=92933 RepID=A0A433J0L4_9PROT|nr:sulfate ABC transporter permease subunit CysT [Azospirillum doebereinerae]
MVAASSSDTAFPRAGGAVTSILKKPSVIPGFGLTLGFTLTYLGLIVLLPLAALVVKAGGLGWFGFWNAVFTPRVWAAFQVSFGLSLVGAAINAVFGFVVAWVLVRYSFPGKRLVDALVDLPFALPTAVAGIALSALYAPNGWVGKPLNELFGFKVAFTPIGIAIALTFVGLPFVVRTVQPILQDLPPEEEEAAVSLGATRGQTFWRVVFPAVLPALVTGFALSFARGVGEYGSVIFIAGNMPGLTEILPLLIVIKLEQYDYAGAAAVGTAMLLVSFVMLLILNILQHWMRSRHAR